MNPNQARDFIAKYKGPSVRSFIKPSHLEELSPLLEVHIEAIEVSKAEFHDLAGSYMPHKETLDKFAAAAGVSYNQVSESTRKEGEGCYVGRSQAMVMGPDGKMILGDVCEYEFDVDVRLAELEIKGKTVWNDGQKTTRPYEPKELAAERIQLQKVARQRANTGARNRATVSILGMQTGFKGLFQKNDSDSKSVTFLFSRVIVNAKNELVMNRMLDGIAGNTAALFGPQAAPRALPAAPAHAGMPVDEPFRNASETAPAGDDFALEAEGAGTASEADQIKAAREALEDYYATPELLAANSKAQLRAALDDPKTPLNGALSLNYFLASCKKVWDKQIADGRRIA